MPGDPWPGNEAGLTLVPVTEIVKSEATAVPPSSLIRVLMTLRVAGLSLLVMVQVLVWPMAMVPEQSADWDSA